ncbi:TetR/AcrR family transcriptional regulator [Novosphingobium sp. JCM 18896]|uniref:TetR/AcrR family transcriptional regulator n=1 Tax=Novosphingobium sp. JCM 18896 TaxID=2989731 RepID=UPI0029CA59A4|nr:TetR/AcrR family transcriptional regulator [Novosphingobium sp. JCM 18896]
MIDTEKTKKPRGRPRAFDLEAALTKAEALFHARGYDGVSVANLSEELGINPPSFYAAFDSKAGLFARVLERYAASALPLDRILQPGRDPAEALADLLETAARIYAATPSARGCLVLETVHPSADEVPTTAAEPYRTASHALIRDFVAATRPMRAEPAADLVDVLLSGLSARAREGWDADRLVASARASAKALPAVLAD